MSKVFSIFSSTLSALITMAVVATGVAVAADTAGWRFPETNTTSQQIPTSLLQSRVSTEIIEQVKAVTRPPAQ